MAGEPYDLIAELQNRYERKAVICDATGARIGRIWYQQGKITYDKSSWAQWRSAQAQTYSEALKVIAG